MNTSRCRFTRTRPSARFSRRAFAPLALVALLMLRPAPAPGLGVRIPNQDAEAIARGNAFVATANNPSALYYNPAGITQLKGHNLQVGALNYLGVTSSYRSPGGRRSETDFEIIPVPQVYYTYSPSNCSLAFGVGLYAPFGLGLVWPEDSGFRTLTIEGRLEYITVNPVLAWQVSPTLSLAAGPTINYSKLKIRRGLVSTAAGGDELRFRGDDFDFGFNAGILWQPHEKWSFGANYRAATVMDYEGTASYNPPLAPILPTSAHTSAKFDFPQIISAGVSFRPTPDWNFEINADWSDWETLNNVPLRGTANLGFPGGDLVFPLNWRNSWLYEAGVTRRLGPRWSVSAGYFFSTKTTSETDFNPIVPDTDLHVGSLGVSYKTDRWRYALAGQIITGPYRQINTGTANQFSGQSANGQYRFVVPAITFSVGLHF